MKIPAIALAPIVVICFFGVILAANSWQLPTMGTQFSESSGEEVQIQMIVNGLRCRGTSDFFMQKLKMAPGLTSVETFVQEHRAVINYDPDLVTVDEIRAVIEQPVKLQNGKVVQPFSVEQVLN